MDRSAGLLALFGAIFFAGGMLLTPTSHPDVVQPIAFNHKVHGASDVGCNECHFRCEKNRDEDGDLDCARCEASGFIFCEEHVICPDHQLPGLPAVEVCANCHDGDDPDTQEKAALLRYLESGEAIPWKRVTSMNRSNIYFSHRNHAILESIPCSTCHGAMEEMETPPPSPPVEMDMDWCLECHHDEDASEGCVACHR